MPTVASAAAQSELVLGRYRPLKPLGSGASGSVWLARDETNGLDVALKIVPREGKAGSRAEREAEAASRLRHPSCQRAYGFGRDSQHIYIAYEYTPGRTFREALRSGELEDDTAIEAAVQMLEGLAHAHERGIVHRDVKPSNVLLADGDGVSVRLLDFGLARLPQAETLTAAGDVPGTLAYIAPERLGGEPATAAADVWSIGVLLWEALAGRHPFWRSSLLETARAIALVRTAPAVLAGLFAAWAAWEIPFFPSGWPVALGALAAGAAAVRPRIGLAFALAIPVLPLGNIALALALVYACVAVLMLVLAWREPESGLLFAVGPVLAPLAALGLMPVLTLPVRSGARRAAQAAAAVLTAGIVAGVRHASLPFDGSTAPRQLGLAGSDSATATASVLWHAMLSRPALPVEALVLAAAAVLLPHARSRGLWAVAGLGGAMLAATLLPVPDVAAIPLVVSVWATCAAVALR